MSKSKQVERVRPPVRAAFQTKRLNVWRLRMIPAEGNRERELFVAFRRDLGDECGPLVVATMVVFPLPLDGVAYVDWIEVSTECRREGIGRELFAAVRKQLGLPLHYDGATPEGIAFCNALDREALGR